MQTSRDSQIVSWIGRLGAAGAEHVMHQFAMSRSSAYERLCSLTRDGLLEHHTVLYGRPGMYTATLTGLRWRDIAHLGVRQVRPGGFEHAWQVAQATVELSEAMPDWVVISERLLRSIESELEELFASAQVGNVASRAMLHRPDLVLSSTKGTVVPIEIELSTKSAPRLQAICHGWSRARHVDTVYYLAAPGPRRAVERAITATRTSDRIRVLSLDDIPQLAADLYTVEDQLVEEGPGRARRAYENGPDRRRERYEPTTEGNEGYR